MLSTKIHFKYENINSLKDREKYTTQMLTKREQRRL